MKIAMLSPISWRTPPRSYGPWEFLVSILTEELVAQGVDVTLFATGDSITSAKLRSVVPHPLAENPGMDAKVWECLHISQVFEQASEFDLIHNHFDFLPLSYSGLVSTPVVTTIHGFSSERILPVYEKYNGRTGYVSISDADRSSRLSYLATVYHGIRLDDFHLAEKPGGHLLFFGRIHPDKGTWEAIQCARSCGRPLRIAGIIHDEQYFREKIEPELDDQIQFIGAVSADKRSEVLGEAAALLHLINFEEPFGLSVVEAMACGTPVIAFARGSMPELITPGINGYLVHNVPEAVSAVRIAVHLDRKKIRETAAARFSSKRMAEDYIEVYEKILN